MTDLVQKAGTQPGFVVVLEQLPDNPRFDRETREQLLDAVPRCGRLLGGAKSTLQVLLFFSVARSQEIGSWERAAEMAPTSNNAKPAARRRSAAAKAAAARTASFGMNMPLMSSAFDTAMWLNAAEPALTSNERAASAALFFAALPRSAFR
jgi:hypothetical protein